MKKTANQIADYVLQKVAKDITTMPMKHVTGTPPPVTKMPLKNVKGTPPRKGSPNNPVKMPGITTIRGGQ